MKSNGMSAVMKNINLTALLNGSDVNRIVWSLDDVSDIVNVACSGCRRLAEFVKEEHGRKDLLECWEFCKGDEEAPRHPNEYFIGCIKLVLEMSERLEKWEVQCFPKQNKE